MMKQALTFAALAALTVTSMSSCRSARRAVRVGGDAATLKVKMTGLSPGDTNRPEWLYELSGCIAALTGNLTADSTASFSAIGLKQGLTGCQLRVRSVGSPAGMKFEAEQGVLYFVKDMAVSQDADGSLSSIANLQRLYGISGTSAAIFTLKVPVVFAAAENGSVVTGGIQCSPEILGAGSFERASDVVGEFVFKTEIAAEGAYQCTSLEVRVDGAPDAKHKGSFVGEAGNFNAKPGDTYKTGSLTLTKLQPSKDPGTVGVDVNTKADSCTEVGTVYDPTTHKCSCSDPAKVYDAVKHTCT